MKTLLLASALALASILPAQAEALCCRTDDELKTYVESWNCYGNVQADLALIQSDILLVESHLDNQNRMAVGYYTWRGIEKAGLAGHKLRETTSTCPDTFDTSRSVQSQRLISALRTFNAARKAAGFTDEPKR